MKNDSVAANMSKLHWFMYMGPDARTPADDDEESFKRIEIRASCKLQRGIHVYVLPKYSTVWKKVFFPVSVRLVI